MGSGRTVRTLKRRMAFTGPKHRGHLAAAIVGFLQSFHDLAGWTKPGPPRGARALGPGSVIRVTASPLTPAAQRPLGRIPVLNVAPDVDGGAFPAKSVVDEEFDVTATVFREGHDAVNATVVLTDPAGAETHVPMTLHRAPGWTTGP